MRKTVSTVSLNRGQTVETVLFRHDIAITRLKPGVNEKYSSIKNCFGVLFFLLRKIIVAIPSEAS
jgi:hypothetical protein